MIRSILTSLLACSCWVIGVVACGPGNIQELAILDVQLGLVLDHDTIRDIQCEDERDCQYVKPDDRYGGDPELYPKFSSKFDTSSDAAITKATDLNCNLRYDAKDCRWGNVNKNDSDLDNVDFFLFEKIHVKSWPDSPQPSLLPGGSKRTLKKGYKVLVAGTKGGADDSAILISNQVKCQKSSGSLSFNYWLYAQSSVEVLMLEPITLKKISRPFQQCDSVTPSNGRCQVILPPVDEPFHLAIRAHHFVDPVGNAVFINDIEYEADEVCENLQGLGSDMHEESMARWSEDVQMIKEASDLDCFSFDESCRWKNSGNLDWLQVSGKMYGPAWKKLTSISELPAGSFSMAKAPAFSPIDTQANLESDPLPCQEGEAVFRLRFWTSPTTKLRVCVVDVETVREIICSPELSASANAPGPVDIVIPGPIMNPFKFIISAYSFHGSTTGIIAIDDIVYVGKLCQKEIKEATQSPTIIRLVQRGLVSPPSDPFKIETEVTTTTTTTPEPSTTTTSTTTTTTTSTTTTTPSTTTTTEQQLEDINDIQPLSVDELPDSRAFVPITSAGELGCSFETSGDFWGFLCPYGNENTLNPTQQSWQLASHPQAVRTLVETSNTASLPEGTFGYATFDTFGVANLISDEMYGICSREPGFYSFKFWKSANVQLRICAVDSHSGREIECSIPSQVKLNEAPGPAVWQLPVELLNGAFYFKLQALSTGPGYAVVDDLSYTGNNLCVSERQARSIAERKQAIRVSINLEEAGLLCQQLSCAFGDKDMCGWTPVPVKSSNNKFVTSNKATGIARNVEVGADNSWHATVTLTENDPIAVLESPQFLTEDVVKLRFTYERRTYGSEIHSCIDDMTPVIEELDYNPNCRKISGPHLNALEKVGPVEATVLIKPGNERVYLVVKHRSAAQSGAAAVMIDDIQLFTIDNAPLC